MVERRLKPETHRRTEFLFSAVLFVLYTVYMAFVLNCNRDNTPSQWMVEI